jgi:NitT/TauT family transport system substrate-binding protein
MAMRASDVRNGGADKTSDAGENAGMLAMADMSTDASTANSGMDMAMDMSDIDGKVSLSASGEKLAVFNKFNGWPELKEAVMSGTIKAAYLLAPMVMDLADGGIPVKIVALGHRSGAVIMTGTKSTARNLGDLRGKRIAIPSRFAVDNIFVHRLMKKYGLTDADVTLVEMPPPDMPAALYSGAVDAYATGEPFGALAQRKGYARILHMTRNEWPKYICCVLTVRQDLIDSDRATVQRLVDNVLSAGQWLEAGGENRHLAADLAARREFFGQDSSLLRFVRDNPKDRVTYGDLRIVRSEMDEIMNLAYEGKVLKHKVPYEKYVDESFMLNYHPAEIKLAK